MTQWQKVPKAKYYLEIRKGRYRESYRVNYRANGVTLRQKLEGDFKRWQDAEEEAERLIAEKRFGEATPEEGGERIEDTCDKLVALKKPPLLSVATHEQIEIFTRVHFKPYFRGECPYVEAGAKCPHESYIVPCVFSSKLTPAHWLSYKAHFRLHRPSSPLFNHWKYMTMLFKFSFERGLLERPVTLAFNQKKEDAKKEGQLIPNYLFRVFLRCANTTWRRRATIGRFSGQRPGLICRLRKSQVDLTTGLVKVEKGDSKNRKAYEFKLEEVSLVELRAQAMRYPDSPYFFPNERNHRRHMDRCLTGWHSAWAAARTLLLEQSGEAAAAGDQERAFLLDSQAREIRAEGENAFTPHDLRHTCLTEIALTPGIKPFVEAHEHDLSVAMWDETYAHVDRSKVKDIEPDGRPRAQQILGTT